VRLLAAERPAGETKPFGALPITADPRQRIPAPC